MCFYFLRRIICLAMHIPTRWRDLSLLLFAVELVAERELGGTALACGLVFHRRLAELCELQK